MKKILYGTLIITTLLLITSISIHTLMAKTPQQPYEVLAVKGNLELRYYPEAVMATVKNRDTTYKSSSNNNFRVLANYIFGGNSNNEKIAMTAPVHMAFEKESSSMSFVMPEGYNLQNLPQPSGSSVQLHKANEEYVAVVRFGGFASDKKIKQKQEELKTLLLIEGIEHDNQFRFLGYNAPWDLINRRNEVIVGISKETVALMMK